VGTSLTVASAPEHKTALFAAEAAKGNLKRSSLNEFLEISRKASAQLVTNLHRAAEMIQSFKQARPTVTLRTSASSISPILPNRPP
jgi:hypothetical protein